MHVADVTPAMHRQIRRWLSEDVAVGALPLSVFSLVRFRGDHYATTCHDARTEPTVACRAWRGCYCPAIVVLERAVEIRAE
jgi:hypothetical protein